MGARLLFRDSRGRDGQVALTPSTPCYVGRALDCAIRTDDPMVSRKHSMIRMENGGYYVEDLGSSNGTHVNNQRVSKHRLNHNDVLRCGSLLLRYVEDGPLEQPQSGPSQPSTPAGPASRPGPAGHGGASPWSGQGSGVGQPASGYPAQGTPAQGSATTTTAGGSGKRGTQRLDVPASPPVGQSGVFGGSAAHGPYGGPPAMPQDPSPQNHGPPDMPAPDTNPFGPPTRPEGGMVSGVSEGTSPGNYNPFAKPPAEESVVVEEDDESASRLGKDLDDTRRRLDELQSSYDREVADGKRLRAETATLRDKIEKLEETIADREEQIKSHQAVAEDLRGELAQSRDELAQARNELAAQAEDLHAKERQIGRIQEDIAKLKDDKEDIARQLAEVSKTKDEGWKKLNDQLSEIEHLREVINEQERMLEERKVGLISQEEVIKELRGDKDKQLQQHAQLKAERDELVADMRRQGAQLQAVEEENRRLSRMLAESQSGGGGGQAAVDLTDELREVRIEVRKLEADRDRYQEMYERSGGEVQRLGDRLATLEVELREANERKTAATSSQSVIEDSLAKAEVARHKAAEEALAASKERDEAVAAAEKSRREADRLRQRLTALESESREGPGDSELQAENEALKRKLEAGEGQVGDLERALSELQAELDRARAGLDEANRRAQAASEAAESAGGRADTLDEEPAGGGELAAAIREKAVEVYENVNDILSEIRNNLRLVKRDFEGMVGEQTDDEVRIMRETLQTLVDNAEDAKGVVRGLRELAEFG